MTFSAEHFSQRLDACLNFWFEHGLDRDHGGFLTSLDSQGQVVDTDKAIWMQGRAAWMFAHAARTVSCDEKTRQRWQTAAQSAADFLVACPRTPQGRLAFLVTREGQALRYRRYAFSEMFAAMGLAELSVLTQDEDLATEARHFATTFVTHDGDVVRFPPKWEEDQRPTRSIATPLMRLCLSQVLRETCGWESANSVADTAIQEIRSFCRPELEGVLEVLHEDGSVLDSDLGRTLNPGHALEAAWFLFAESRRTDDAACRKLAEDMAEFSWCRGWDQECGGVRAFVPLDDRPIQEPLQHHKYWWPQLEAMLAALHAHQATGKILWLQRAEEVWSWFEAHHLSDSGAECWGWLDRQGQPATLLLGSTWKGPFHYPRALLFAARLLDPDS